MAIAPALPPPAGRAAAFDLGSRGDAPVLLLHGLTGSPAELLPLGEELAGRGLRVVAPLLPGHGLGAVDLSTAGADDWLRVAGESLAALSRPAHLVGHSMGALLALRLAAESDGPAAPRGKVRSLTLLAPAVRLAGVGRPLSSLLWRLPVLHRTWPLLPISTLSDVRDPSYRGFNPKNDRVSLRALAELRFLQRTCFSDASRVTVPSLVVLGARDRTVSNRWAQRLVAPLHATLWIAPQSGHQLGLDYDRRLVFREILAHFARAASP